ncbi:MAG: hypothetical protein K6G91_02870 [Kiritimatiellae bacterium]|nr:hypothetical protein [Kiritimatiellia bacterium]
MEADWGDETRTVPVIGGETSAWEYKEGLKTKEAKVELFALAEENLKSQDNYVIDAASGNNALRIGNIIYRVTRKGLFHGADRRLRRIGAVIARIGDVLNASVEVPGVEAPWHYRIASVNFGTPEYVLLTSKSVGGTEEVVEVQSLYAINAKADATAQTATSTGTGLAEASGAARELNHTGTSRLDRDSIANLKAAWQGLFAEKPGGPRLGARGRQEVSRRAEGAQQGRGRGISRRRGRGCSVHGRPARQRRDRPQIQRGE